MYPSSPHMYSRLGPWDRCARPGSLPRPRGPRRPFVSGFDGIERRAALMRRNPIFADIAVLASVPLRCHRRSAAQRPQTATMGDPTLLVAASHQRPPPFLNKNNCRARDTPPYGQLSTANLHVTESLEDFNEPCPLALQSPHAMRICTMSVGAHGYRRSLRRRHTSAPTWCSRYSIECTQTRLTRAPIAAKQQRRSSGNWAAWAPAAMRFTRVALVIYGSTALAPASLATTVPFPGDVLRAVVSAERCAWGLGLGGPSEYRNGNKATAECTTARTFGKHSTPPVHQRHRPYPSRLHQWTIRAPDDRRTRTPRAEPKPYRLHPSLHHVSISPRRVSIHAPRLQQPLSPHPTTLLPQHLQRAPAHSFLAPASYNISSKRSKHAQNTHAAYNELVTSATPTTSAHIHRPLATRRALRAPGSSAIASSTPPHVTHGPRISPRLLNGDSTPIRAILCLRNAFTYCRHSAQSPLSPCFRRARRNPRGIPRPDRQHSGSRYQPSMSHPPSVYLI
ncbi:hypothetical protein B0H14DRAFT_3572384 [Mycena olivaceomarginata]|nr:hypothetical protein B0H14DRAFT_3572384 [Mycena olivaceomarginata]